MKYKVTIEEVIAQEFEVEADSEEKLYETVRELYKKGELILDNPDLIQTNVQLSEGSEFVSIY